MLKGRESLRRIIGKRRRVLPNLPRILSSSPTSSSNSLKNGNDKLIIHDSAITNADSNSIDVVSEAVDTSNDFVTCPVCSSQIRGDDRTVNSHLDFCLVKGTKRKLSQRTLLQFSFSSKLKSSKCANEGVHAETSVIQDCDPTKDDLPQLTSISTDEVTCAKSQGEMTRPQDGTSSESSLALESVTEHAESSEKNIGVDNNDEIVYSYSVPLESGAPNFDVEGILTELSEMALETYIVGRKYVDTAEVVSGACICFLRDPTNIKDQNAIKVVSPDSDSGRVLGFLPRELAQHLSPLIDKYQLNFKGVITSVPKNSLDIVPVEIMCLNAASCNDVEKDDVPMLKSLCVNIFRLMKSGKICPSTPIKYQENFRLMMEGALKGNLCLFTDAEKLFLDSFSSMSDDSQRLFVRLYTRKGPWFRISSFSYPEILDYQQAVNELSEASYACSFGHKSEVNDNDMEELLNVLTVNELSEILKILKKVILQDSKIVLRKKELIALLYSSYKDGLCPLLPSLIADRTATCVRISPFAESLLWRVQRLFFLDGEQDLSSFLLVDLQILKYPEYKCTISCPVFCSRNDLLAYEEAIEVAQVMDQSLDEGNSKLVLQCIEIAEYQLSSYFKMKNQALPLESEAPFLQRFSAAWVNSKVVLLGVSFHEQERRYQDAIKLLKLLLNCYTSDGRRGYWTLRLSIDLEHTGCIEESLSVAEDGVLDPWVRAGSRMALQRRVIRLGKPPRRWKAPSYAASVKRKITEVQIHGRPLNGKVGTKSRFYGEDGEQCGVEELALQFYAGEGGGWQGVHAESGIWLTIYGLLMWDVIFSDVPNTFRTKFQNSPLDMDSDSFYDTRKTIIEPQLQNIHEGMAEAILIMSWELHQGTLCRGVNWERNSLSELRAAVTCIGGPCLANLCRLLAQDYRSWTSGMPDLLLWRFNGDYKGEAKLVEVKGPKDRLSEQQRAWLLILMDCGFTAEVCKVNPPLQQ
ncbi:fanconi-associated nuclease 1 homolog isoform X1 [Spinacia oleracea]|uniref:Fanconi-associated nuclease n=1 Tax=Spinacia oleracea TaxID=3562 RepID=A0A9R0I7S4_SPIOL|nr:fanconi-associated nuclease 1 homolog isoform X1 [Spinacia oleracea]